MKTIENIEKEQLKAEPPQFNIGDTVKVHTRVKEGDKERIQVFAGIVIARHGRGMNEMFTVRRISHGEGVERVFPVHAPTVEKVVVEQEGAPRRAKLYYLRNVRGNMAASNRTKKKK